MAAERTDRRLAAILAADIAGFSRLMEQDERATLATLTAHRDVMDPLVTNYHGRIANTAGDSVLAEFASVVDAVECASGAAGEILATIERGAGRRSAGCSSGMRHPCRRRHGQGPGTCSVARVNIAARLQELSPRRAAYCVSEAARSHLGDTPAAGAWTQGGVQSVEEHRHADTGLSSGRRRVRLARGAADATHPAEPPIDRRPAVRPHQQRDGGGLFRGRSGRRHHHGAVAQPGPVRRCASLVLLHRAARERSRRHRPGARRAVSPHRLRPPGTASACGSRCTSSSASRAGRLGPSATTASSRTCSTSSSKSPAP